MSRNAEYPRRPWKVRGILRDPAIMNPVAVASSATPVVKKARMRAVGRRSLAWVMIAVVYDANAKTTITIPVVKRGFITGITIESASTNATSRFDACLPLSFPTVLKRHS